MTHGVDEEDDSEAPRPVVGVRDGDGAGAAASAAVRATPAMSCGQRHHRSSSA